MRIQLAIPLLIGLAACSGSTPTGPDDSGVRFSPPSGGVLVAQGSFKRFSARDADGQELTAVFSVDGETKHRGKAYNWYAATAGFHVIQAEVDFQSHTRTAVWTVEVRLVDVNFAPPVTDLSATAGDRWATLDLQWTRPAVPELYPEIVRYRIYFGQIPWASIYDSHVQSIDVDDDPDRSQQSATLFDLAPDQDSYVQIVAVNSAAASSVASALLTARSRGSGSIDLPPPLDLTIETPSTYGTLIAHWSAPTLDPGSVELDFYRVYWADFPFSPDEVGSAEVAQVAATDPQMSYDIESLSGETVYYVRVQAFDLDGRASAMTHPESGITLITPIPFTLSGRAIQMNWEFRGLLAMEGAEFVAGTDMTTSDAAGYWTLPTMTQGELFLDSSSGGVHYPAHIQILAAEDREFDILFLPKQTIDVASSQAELNGPMSHMEFLHRMTGTRNGSPNNPGRIHRWESYPVKVQKSTLIREGHGESVDYGIAFERAVDAWNQAIGFQLLELVAEAPEIGVSVAVDIEQGSPLLGETRFILPSSSWFTQDIPQHLRIHLTEFNFQSLANRVILHELGHVLGMLHSPSEDHVMNSAAPDLPIDPEEADIAYLLSILPQGIPLSWYLED